MDLRIDKKDLNRRSVDVCGFYHADPVLGSLCKRKSPEEQYILEVVNHIRKICDDASVLCIALAYVLLRDNPHYSVRILVGHIHTESGMVGTLDNVVVVSIPNHHRVFVDFEWSSRWSTYRKTQEYENFLSSIPEILLISEEQLDCILKQYCKYIKRCFDFFKMSLPPWRTNSILKEAYINNIGIDAHPLFEYIQAHLRLTKPISTNCEKLTEPANGVFAKSLDSMLNTTKITYFLHEVSITAPPERLLLSSLSNSSLDMSLGADLHSTTQNSNSSINDYSMMTTSGNKNLKEYDAMNNYLPTSEERLDNSFKQKAKMFVDLSNEMRSVIDTVPHRGGIRQRKCTDVTVNPLRFEKQISIPLVESHTSMLAEQLQSNRNRWAWWTFLNWK